MELADDPLGQAGVILFNLGNNLGPLLHSAPFPDKMSGTVFSEIRLCFGHLFSPLVVKFLFYLLFYSSATHECDGYRHFPAGTDRSVNYKVHHSHQAKCDNTLALDWYRFQGPAGDRIPDVAPPINHCGTHAPGWLRGGHPSIYRRRQQRTVCYHWAGNVCKWSNPIKVTNCGSFYVYQLTKTPLCRLRYCVTRGKMPQNSFSHHWASIAEYQSINFH